VKINMPRILGAILTMLFLSGLVQTAQCTKKVETGTGTLKEPTAINCVYLLNGDRISGAVVSLNKDVLFLECLLSKKLRIDLRAVTMVDFQPKMQRSFQPRKEEMDIIEFVNRDKITGDVLSLSEKTITIKGEYGELVLKKEGLSHIIFGLRERLDLGFPNEDRNAVILKLVNDDIISGKLLNFGDDVFHFTAKYSPDLKIKSQHVSSLTFTRWPETGVNWKRNEGLVAYYPFNGNANDESKHENHGKVTGATLTEDRFGNPNSAYNFSGKDNYINCGNSSSLELTGDMTIEAWIYPTGLNYDADHGIIVKKGDCTHASRDAYYLELTGSSLPANINFSLSDGPSLSYYTVQGVIPSLNKWYHVASTYDRAEGKVRVYVDGLLRKTFDRNTQTKPAASHNVFIGREGSQNYSGRRFIGKIDEVRLYNRALSETEIQDYCLIKGLTTAYDSYTKLMLHMDGTNGSTRFTDETGKTVTAHGNAQISTAPYKFGGASGLFNGTNAYLTVPNSSDFDFGSGDFTIDFWCYPKDNDFTPIIDLRTSNEEGICIYREGGLLDMFVAWSWPSDMFVFKLTGNNNEWSHVALVRSGNTFTGYVNGVAATPHTDARSIAAPNGTIKIGIHHRGNIEYFNGYVDELRISKGIARWTSNFTPPISPY